MGRAPAGRAFGTRCSPRASANELKQSLNPSRVQPSFDIELSTFDIIYER